MSDILAQQAVLHHLMERAEKNFKKIGKANLTPAKIRYRMSSLKAYWTQYQDGHMLLLKTIAEPSWHATEYFRDNHFEVTEDLFRSTCDFMNEHLEELEPVVSPNQSFEHSIIRHDNYAASFSQLPQIRLPQFEGNHADWENFRDRFSLLIIKNKSLNDFAQMHHLASSLKGRALECISNIPVTAENFEFAWQALTARFENKKRLIALHFSALLDLTGVKGESASELHALCDKVNIAVASLVGLGRMPSDLWSDFLVHIVTQKIDPATRKAWNVRTSDASSPPTCDELLQFTASRARALEDCHPSTVSKAEKTVTSHTPSKPRHSHVHVATTASASVTACPLCKNRHFVNLCPKFIAQSPTQRREIIKRFKRCFNCLSASHTALECKSRFNCRLCQKRHHTMLHVESDSARSCNTSNATGASVSPGVVKPNDVVSLFAATPRRARAQILLATARVQVKSASGRCVTVRALVHQGSEATFISESLAQMLHAKRIRRLTTISAIGGARLDQVRQSVDITISPLDEAGSLLSTIALILPSLTSYTPRRTADLSNLEYLRDILWADSNSTGSDPIHLLIGADRLYSYIILDGIRKGKIGQPFVQNTIFGWIISDPLELEHAVCTSSMHISVHHCSALSSLDSNLRRFWEIEDLPNVPIASPQDKQCEDHYVATHSRCADGRYVVRLPFKSSLPIDIGPSRQHCENLMRSLSHRFSSQPTLRAEYCDFMREYETLGHMIPVPDALSLS